MMGDMIGSILAFARDAAKHEPRLLVDLSAFGRRQGQGPLGRDARGRVTASQRPSPPMCLPTRRRSPRQGTVLRHPAARRERVTRRWAARDKPQRYAGGRRSAAPARLLAPSLSA